MRLPPRPSARARWSGALLALLVACGSRAARADDARPSLDVRGLRPPTDPASGLVLEPATTPGHLRWNAALWGSYSHRPVILRRGADVVFRPVDHQISLDLTAGVGLGARAAVGLDLPIVVFQTSGGTRTPEVDRALGAGALPATALGDVALSGKVTLISPTLGDLGGFALAAAERLSLPTGARTSYAGEGQVTSETRLFAEYRMIAGVHAGLGFRARPYERTLVGETFGHELPFHLGLSLRPQALGIDPEGRFTWYLEAHGHLPAGPKPPFSSEPQSAARLALSARYALRAVSVLASVETSFVRGVGSPPLRGVLALAWTPGGEDSDGDGVDDEDDLCLALPEDLDGFQDDDGCPEWDNDEDGVGDEDDRCPTQPEDEDGFEDEDGCPEPGG